MKIYNMTLLSVSLTVNYRKPSIPQEKGTPVARYHLWLTIYLSLCLSLSLSFLSALYSFHCRTKAATVASSHTWVSLETPSETCSDCFECDDDLLLPDLRCGDRVIEAAVSSSIRRCLMWTLPLVFRRCVSRGGPFAEMVSLSM